MNLGEHPSRETDAPRGSGMRRKSTGCTQKPLNLPQGSGTTTTRGRTPQRAISKLSIERSKKKRNRPGNSADQRKVSIPSPKKMRNVQKRLLDHHDDFKQRAVQLWSMLGNPLFGAPRNPETGFHAEMIAAEKEVGDALSNLLGWAARRLKRRSAITSSVRRNMV